MHVCPCQEKPVTLNLSSFSCKTASYIFLVSISHWKLIKMQILMFFYQMRSHWNSSDVIPPSTDRHKI